MTQNPYAPPRSKVADVGQSVEVPTIWNPNSAANWSLLFTPAFGAFLHMKNWEALGEPTKASAAKVWGVTTLIVFVGISVVAVFVPKSSSLALLPRPIGLVLLLGWYFSSGRPQAQYVKSRYGNDYPRKSWGKPLLVALLVIAGYFLFMIVVGVVAGAVRRGV
jgi:hypothetical protein